MTKDALLYERYVANFPIDKYESAAFEIFRHLSSGKIFDGESYGFAIVPQIFSLPQEREIETMALTEMVRIIQTTISGNAG